MKKIRWLSVFGSSLVFIACMAFFMLLVQGFLDEPTRSWRERGGVDQDVGPGDSLYTMVPVNGVGDVAVRMRLPEEPRYGAGAPVVMFVPSFFATNEKAFEGIDGITDYGFAEITLMYPGRRDRQTGMISEGEDDFGGPATMAALRDVLLFASGRRPNSDGDYLRELTSVKLNTQNLGLYAFSQAGLAADQLLAQYGNQVPVDYFVGRENPTESTLSAQEVGYYLHGLVRENPAYNFWNDYDASRLKTSYASAKWDVRGEAAYVDVNANDLAESKADYFFEGEVPSVFGKRLYSVALLTALRDHGLSSDNWPDDLATPEEAAQWWAAREAVGFYDDIAQKTPDVKTMLVFAKQDHLLPNGDKPQIHQAFDGLTAAKLWVRLNPDSVYVKAMHEKLALDYQEHAANSAPSDWMNAYSWGHQDGAGAVQLIPFAAICEMADRTATSNWSNDLTDVISVK